MVSEDEFGESTVSLDHAFLDSSIAYELHWPNPLLRASIEAPVRELPKLYLLILLTPQGWTAAENTGVSWSHLSPARARGRNPQASSELLCRFSFGGFNRVQ